MLWKVSIDFLPFVNIRLLPFFAFLILWEAKLAMAFVTIMILGITLTAIIGNSGSAYAQADANQTGKKTTTSPPSNQAS
jgi:ABC-type multidrug transport system fused ATPase/permease subunit